MGVNHNDFRRRSSCVSTPQFTLQPHQAGLSWGLPRKQAECCYMHEWQQYEYCTAALEVAGPVRNGQKKAVINTRSAPKLDRRCASPLHQRCTNGRC